MWLGLVLRPGIAPANQAGEQAPGGCLKGNLCPESNAESANKTDKQTHTHMKKALLLVGASLAATLPASATLVTDATDAVASNTTSILTVGGVIIALAATFGLIYALASMVRRR